MTLSLSHLIPDTSYDIYCYGRTVSNLRSESQPAAHIRTQEGTIAISRIKYLESSISFHVDSNIPSVVSCSLFDAECMLSCLLLM